MTITVHENNRSDSPREVSVDEVLDKVRGMDFPPGVLPERRINLALVEFGSFDPRSDEYAKFEREALRRRKKRLKDG